MEVTEAMEKAMMGEREGMMMVTDLKSYTWMDQDDGDGGHAKEQWTVVAARESDIPKLLLSCKKENVKC